MHPALSKAERKRYAGFDPDQWYPWTQDVSSEFTDLMRRSPRDTSFARGFAYVAQRAVPEGNYIPTTALLQNLGQLPAAFRGPEGTGFLAAVDRPGHATVRYGGMPGFANACIAIQGELTQRLQASGAQSVVVKHSASCRVNGAATCEFEVEWTGEAPPPDTTPVNMRELVDEEGEEGEDQSAAVAAPAQASAQASAQVPAQVPAQAPPAQESGQAPVSEPTKVAKAAAPPQPPPVAKSNPEAALATDVDSIEAAGSGDELFAQLRKRLAEADRQARLYADARQEIDKLRVELSSVRAQAEADVAAARKERTEALDAAASLKTRIREIVGGE